MTTVVDNHIDGPSLHAFVIGVGYYRHLPGGAGPVLEDSIGLEQVHTPPLSAMAVLDWLTRSDGCGYLNPEVPLGSIELLMSQETDLVYGGTPVQRATLPNAQEAVRRWRERCDRSVRNVALFYFCGHGLERDKQYLLLEDFGQAPDNPLAMSIDLDRFHDGMTACLADTQLFIADACRQVPWSLIKTYGDMGNPLIQPALGGNTDRNAPILRATAQGMKAFGEPDTVTNFTQALLHALRGAGATEEPDGTDQWVVRYMSLAGAIQTLLAAAPPGTPQQVCRTGGEAADVRLTCLAGPPQVPVHIDCLPPDSAVALELRSELRQISESRQPTADPWVLEVPADYMYLLAATYDDARYSNSARAVAILPPLRSFSVQAQVKT